MTFLSQIAAFLIFISLSTGAGYRLVNGGVLNIEYFNQIRSRVSEERGLNWLEPVAVEIVDKDQVRKFLEEEMDEEYPPEKIEGLSRAYIHMGLLDPGTDLKKELVDFVTFAGAGFYDSEKKKLYLVNKAVESSALSKKTSKRDTAAELVVGHELAHALDDQHFDLDKLGHKYEENDDASLAVTSLVEGCASIVGFAVIYRPGMSMEELFHSVAFLNRLNTRMFGILSHSTPDVIREMLLFSYDAGSQFVAELYRINGNWSAVNMAYQNPPDSTEEIMHPEKYIRQNDPPIEVNLQVDAADFGEGWNEIDRNTLGEFGVFVLLKRFVRKNKAVVASEGWGGDRYVVVEGPAGKFVWIWRTVWDSDRDASEFAQAYMKLLRKKYRRPKALPESSENTYYLKSGKGQMIRVEIRGREVTVIESSDKEDFSRATGKPF